VTALALSVIDPQNRVVQELTSISVRGIPEYDVSHVEFAPMVPGVPFALCSANISEHVPVVGIDGRLTRP